MGEDRKQPENWQNGAIDPERTLHVSAILVLPPMKPAQGAPSCSDDAGLAAVASYWTRRGLPLCQNFPAHMHIIVNRGTVDARNDGAALA
jgi:hypothetical protein